ncbi:DNA repair protein RecO, partial [Thermodesulfobacteriota bacterium]
KERYLRMFEARIFKELGLMPQFGCCVECGRDAASTKTLRFSAAAGGVLCEKCRSGREGLIPLAVGTARILDHAMRIDLDRLGRLGFSERSLKESRQVMQSFVRYHTGKEPRSMRFMAEVRSGGYPWP